MTEPQRIAALLANDLDGGAAAPLVAILEDDGVVVDREGVGYLRELEAAGCVHEGKRTPLGSRVALVLQAEHGIALPPRDL